jgi:hypothetical protein
MALRRSKSSSKAFREDGSVLSGDSQAIRVLPDLGIANVCGPVAGLGDSAFDEPLGGRRGA